MLLLLLSWWATGMCAECSRNSFPCCAFLVDKCDMQTSQHPMRHRGSNRLGPYPYPYPYKAGPTFGISAKSTFVTTIKDQSRCQMETCGSVNFKLKTGGGGASGRSEAWGSRCRGVSMMTVRRRFMARIGAGALELGQSFHTYETPHRDHTELPKRERLKFCASGMTMRSN
jgi:hypothetical protein